MKKLMKIAALVELARIGLHRRRLVVLRRQRRNRALGTLALLGGAGAAYWLLSRRGEESPAWLQKKQRKEARREAARQRNLKAPERPPEVHVENGADTSLKVPLGEGTR